MKTETEGVRVYPEQYLHVSDPRTGDEWIVPLRGNASLDLKKQVKKWIKSQGLGFLDGNLMPRLEGEFYAQIMTDGRSPDSVVCWQSGGFYTKPDLF